MKDKDLDCDEYGSAMMNYLKRGRWHHIQVQLEMKSGYISLNREEWKIFNRFVDKHRENKDIRTEHFLNLPKKVRILIRDWVDSRVGFRRDI